MIPTTGEPVRCCECDALLSHGEMELYGRAAVAMGWEDTVICLNCEHAIELRWEAEHS